MGIVAFLNVCFLEICLSPFSMVASILEFPRLMCYLPSCFVSCAFPTFSLGSLDTKTVATCHATFLMSLSPILANDTLTFLPSYLLEFLLFPWWLSSFSHWKLSFLPSYLFYSFLTCFVASVIKSLLQFACLICCMVTSSNASFTCLLSCFLGCNWSDRLVIRLLALILACFQPFAFLLPSFFSSNHWWNLLACFPAFLLTWTYIIGLLALVCD